MLRREDVHGGVLQQDLAGQGINLGDALHLIAPELDPVGRLAVGGLHLQRVAPHAEGPAAQIVVVALVVDVHQVAQELVPLAGLALPQGDHHLAVVLGGADAVDAGDGGDDDHVPAAEEG